MSHQISGKQFQHRARRSEPSHSGRLSSNFAAWSRQIEGCIRDGQKAGEISRDIDPRVLAAFLLNSLEGAILRMKVEKDGSPLDHFMTLVFSRVLA